jgi:hypothetical protein
MPLNPLAPVTDYQSMLNRIFWFTTAAALAAVWVLRAHLGELDALLGRIDAATGIGGKGLPAPGGYLLPALGVGLAARVFRLHARVSDWLGIRERFDIEVIIGEFAEQLGVDLSGVSEEGLRAGRREVMRKAFYPHVSQWPPAIDGQLVQQALDAWSWYWVGVEAATLATLTGFWLLSGGAHTVGWATLGAATAVGVAALPFLRRQCARYGAAQVRAILEDRRRADGVRTVLDELTGGQVTRRMAA